MPTYTIRSNEWQGLRLQDKREPLGVSLKISLQWKSFPKNFHGALKMHPWKGKAPEEIKLPVAASSSQFSPRASEARKLRCPRRGHRQIPSLQA